MATLQAGVYYDHPGWYRLVCRYDPWMQQNLKASIGLGNYKYDPDLKLWYVREPYKKATVDLLTSHGYEVSFEGKEEKKKEQKSGPRNVSSEKKDNPWSVIFSRISDRETQHKLFRNVALVLHPDTGTGNEEAMKELNEAWSKLLP